MTDLAMSRQAYADEIDALCTLKTRALVDALATVPREQFLPPGPWLVRSESDIHGPRQTEDADPRRVYHNYSIAIDAARQLFNGETLNAQIGQAFRRSPMPPGFTRLRRDRHDTGPGCWLHATSFCLAID